MLFKNWKHVFKMVYQIGPNVLKKKKKNHIWILVDLPLSKTTIWNKWVYKIKIKSDGLFC